MHSEIKYLRLVYNFRFTYKYISSYHFHHEIKIFLVINRNESIKIFFNSEDIDLKANVNFKK